MARLRVVNDPAELAIKLMTDFNADLTNDESQKQALLQKWGGIVAVLWSYFGVLGTFVWNLLCCSHSFAFRLLSQQC